MPRRHCAAALAGLLIAILASVAPPAHGQQRITLAPDRDSTLIEEPQGLFGNARGKAIFAGKANASNPYPIKRAALRFDLAGALPPGSTIQSVSLGLRVLKINFTETVDRTVFLHRLTADWGEGSSNPIGRDGGGAPATNGDATWIHRFYPGELWATPGGDFIPTESASTVLGASRLERYTFDSTAPMVADVQAWVDDPATNFGWILLGENEPNSDRHTARRIGSREQLIADNRPQLTIDFTAPPRQTCRFGTVDLGGAGVAQNVLTVNGSAGDGSRTVPVPVDTGISIDMAASGSGPNPAAFVMYLWLGEPQGATVTPLPKNLGSLCFPMLVTGGSPQPLKTWNNIGRQSKLGVPDFPSTPAPSNVLNAASGTDSAVTVTLQGILLDNGSAADAPASITNAVVLRVE